MRFPTAFLLLFGTIFAGCAEPAQPPAVVDSVETKVWGWDGDGDGVSDVLRFSFTFHAGDPLDDDAMALRVPFSAEVTFSQYAGDHQQAASPDWTLVGTVDFTIPYDHPDWQTDVPNQPRWEGRPDLAVQPGHSYRLVTSVYLPDGRVMHGDVASQVF